MDFYHCDAGSFNHQELRMTDCKHRWEPTTFGIKYRNPGSYWYQCKRCNSVIWTILLEKT